MLHATTRKVADSIPDEVIGFFNWRNPSNCTMALGSTQPQTTEEQRFVVRFCVEGTQCKGYL
jgi:hypothetical protein